MDKITSVELVLVNGQPAVRYRHGDGTETIKVGGTKAFRNNNPGNVGYSDFMVKLGAIGVDKEGRSIFPDWETGNRAMATLLREGRYRDYSIGRAIYIYAHPEGGNPTEEYIQYVATRSGLPRDKRINEMTDDEFDRFQAAMREFEDGTPGYDLVTLDPSEPSKLYRIEYLKFKKDGSPKDPANYGPDVPVRHDRPVNITPIKATTPAFQPSGNPPNGHRHSGQHSPSHAGASRSGEGETLERHGGNVYRKEKDGSMRGYFVSK